MCFYCNFSHPKKYSSNIEDQNPILLEHDQNVAYNGHKVIGEHFRQFNLRHVKPMWNLKLN